MITRGTCWSMEGRHLFAAVAEYEMDVVLIDGLVEGTGDYAICC